MTNILITGALGYIGSVLSPYLIRRGYNVIGVDTGFFKDSILFPGYNYKVLFLDMRNFDCSLLEKIDCVVHLAGMSNDPMLDLNPEKLYNPTRDYTISLAKKCKQRGIKFIFASSCSVYGIGKEENLTESSPVNPQTGYSLNKYQIEQDLTSLTDKNFTPLIFRFATVYGPSPRLRFDLVINMLCGMAFTTKKIILNSNGKAWRPNLHILDLCKAVECGIKTDIRGMSPVILNVGNEEDNKQIFSLANMIKDTVLGSSLIFLNSKISLSEENELIKDRKIKNGTDSRTYKVSFKKISHYFPDFKCEWNVKTGIEALIKQFLEIQLSEKQFFDRKYYRLQTMEDLLTSKKLDENLFWTGK